MIETIKVDLHCHSSLSDGDHSPAYVAHSIAATGAEWAALTDHNSLSGQHQFRTVLEKRGVHSIVGLEIDARSPIGVLHLLGYGLDPEYQPLLDVLHHIRQPFWTSARYWISRLGSAADAQHDSDEASGAPNSKPKPPRPPSTEEAISLIHHAGGLAFLAHPLAGMGTIQNLEKALDWLQPEGIDGMEAFHKPYSRDTQQDLLEVATRRRLLCVAGSDFHGIHHSDGASPGVDMPLVHWQEFLVALAYGAPKGQPSARVDPLVT